MNKKVRPENVAQQIKHWKNPLESKVESRRLFKIHWQTILSDCADWPADVTRSVIMMG